MSAFKRDEVERAFRNYWSTGAVGERWDDWADLFDAFGDPLDVVDATTVPGSGSDGIDDVDQYPGGLAAVFIADDLALKSAVDRSIFVGSNKNDDLIGDWEWDTGNVPAKDDLSNVYAYAAMDQTGDFIIYAGLERLAPNGASHVDIEFNQNPIGLGGPATLEGDGVLVAAAPQHDARMPGETRDLVPRLRLDERGVRVLLGIGRAGEHEVLPDHDPQFVAPVVKTLRFELHVLAHHVRAEPLGRLNVIA